MKTVTLTVEYSTDKFYDAPTSVEISIDEETAKRIKKCQEFLRTIPEAKSIMLEHFANKFLSNKEGDENKDFKADVQHLKIYKHGVIFYAQHNQDSAIQIETEELVL